MRCSKPVRMQQVYVWYKLAGDSASAHAAITEMMLDIAAETGVAGRLFARADDPSTWMEVYEDVEDRVGFERVLAEASAAHEVASYADGGRHVECFCPMSGSVNL